MNYNDFPILANDDYNILKNEYLNKIKSETNDNVSKVFSILVLCKNICFGLNPTYNIKIQRCTNNIKNDLSKLLDDLKFTFKLNETANQDINTFDIFFLTHNLLEGIEIIVDILRSEINNYNRRLFSSIELVLTKSIKNILSALKDSNIILFQHM